MMQRMGRFAGLAGATSLVVFSLGYAGPASATPSTAVPFSQANFNGYATGDELHLGVTALNALSGVTGTLNGLDQGLSSASTSSAGLTSDLTGDLGSVIQPAQGSAVKSFDLGAGLKVDLGTVTNTAGSLLSTLQKAVPLPVTAIAPPNVPAATDEVGPVDVPPLLHADTLLGEAQAAWPGTSCPTGNLSYGLGGLEAASVLTGLPTLTSTGVNTAPLIRTTGTDNQQGVSQSKSLTTLVPNGDGSYGVQTQASDTIAPISVNLLGLATLNIGVHAANGNLDPVTLTATTSGERSVPATLKMSTDDILTVVLTPTTPAGSAPVINESIPLSTIAGSGLDIPLNLSLVQALSQISIPNALSQTLQSIVNGLPSNLQAPVQQVISALSPLLNQVTNVVSTVQNTVVNQPTVQQLLNLLQGTLNLNLGSIHVDTSPHAIGGTGAPIQSADGTRAAGALDLLNIKLGLTGSSINVGGKTIPAGTIPGVSQDITIPAITSLALPNIPLANPVVSHIETSATQQQPIACTTAAVTQQAAPATTPAAPPTTAPKLPFTGGPGGLWQPIAGVAFLGVGGGALALVRRLRRRTAA